MVIFMVTYNVALQHGGLNGEVLSIVAQAIWAPMVIAFLVENLFVGNFGHHGLLHVSRYDPDSHSAI